jgi:RNA polymerase sigma-70 factor, ECF subfamily
METRGSWLADLYESNSTAVFHVCQRLLKNPEDAADATHEVFLRAFTSLTGEPAGKRGRAWLVTVARNYCLDMLRRQKRMGSALNTLAAEPVPYAEAEKAVLDREFVDAVLRQLKDRERQALWQSAVEYRPIGEIGNYLGLSYMAAAQLLHRARRHALVVAGRLAAILGLLQLNRLAKRLVFGVEAHPVAVAIMVPLVVVSLAVASSSRQAGTAPFAGPGSAARGVVGTSSSAPAGSEGEASGRLGLRNAAAPELLHQFQSTVEPLVTALPALGKLTGSVVPAPTPSGLTPGLPSITPLPKPHAPAQLG